MEGSGVKRFRELLREHLSNGTHPNGVPGKPGQRWTAQTFASKVGADERTVRNWRAGRTLPTEPTLVAIEQALFGTNLAYNDARTELSKAWDAEQPQPVPVKPLKRVSADDVSSPSPAAHLARRPRNLPFASLGSLFKGREAIMGDLRAALQNSPVAVAGKALHGLGGVGKTRLAVEYALAHEKSYAALLFLNADTPDKLAPSPRLRIRR
jgi:hypothetical protein